MILEPPLHVLDGIPAALGKPSQHMLCNLRLQAPRLYPGLRGGVVLLQMADQAVPWVCHFLRELPNDAGGLRRITRLRRSSIDRGGLPAEVER